MSEVGILPRIFTTLAEVQDAVGTVLGVSSWFEVTQQTVDTFAEVTGDFEWLHVDVERASAGPFGGTIAHGYLTLSLCARFAAEIFSLQLDAATLNYGIDRVRFPTPLLTGSEVRATISFTGVTEHPAGHLVAVRYVLETKNGTKPVCINDAVLLALASPANSIT